MAKSMYFHRDTLDQRWLDEEQQRGAIIKFLDSGYLKDPPLVQLYDPKTEVHKIVHADDAKVWELRGYVRNPTWIYHPSEGRKIVGEEEAKRLYTNGWYDTPAKFPGNQQGTMRLKPHKEAA